MSRRGFTLFELLIALAVVSLSLTLTFASSQGFNERWMLASYAARLEQSLHFARALAMASGNAIVVCPSADGQNCGGDYNDGWIVFSEAPDNADAKRDDDEVVASVHPALPEPWRIIARNLQSNVRFSPNGKTSRAGRLRLCSTRDASLQYTAVVNINGLVRAGAAEEGCEPP